ncbi:hypothetical protein KFF05_05195 [bacterium SCSIO 12827]|nr:hypothetical protein KFF05_05195 [bacterium SCSIO 12827]
MVNRHATIRAAALALCLGATVLIGIPAQAQDSGAGALFAAIRANDLDAVKQIVASGADPRARDAEGLSAPQAAVRLGHHVIAHYLLAYRRPKVDPPLDQAIDQALDRAVAETEKTVGPIPEAAPPQTEAADAPVTLPEPAPAAVDVADRREHPPVPPDDKDTKVLAPILGGVDAPDHARPQSAQTAPQAAPAGQPENPLPSSETARPWSPTFVTRLGNWARKMMGFDPDDAATAEGTDPAREAQAPVVLTPPPAETGSPIETTEASPSAAPGDPTDTLPDLDKLAAQNNPAMEAANPDLPEADLPRALARSPAPADPLAKALAQPDGGTDPLPDGGLDPLLSMLDAPTDNKSALPQAAAATKSPAKVDLMALAPKDRLAWLDSLLAKPIARDAEESLSDSRDEALSHLRDQAKRKAAEADAAEAALSAAEKKNLKTDTSAVEGPPPGTNLSRRLKIPLPPPDPKGRKNFARDPWFRDVSPDEPDIRAAHRSLKAPPPERGTPPKPTPKVPQLANLPDGKAKASDQKLAVNMPDAPPIRETPRPATPAATPATPADASLDALEKEFGGPAPANDPLAAELGLDTPAGTAPAADPLAAELGLGGAGGLPADDPLAAELGIGAPPEGGQKTAEANDPLSQALGDLSSLLDSDKPSTNPLDAEPPVATSQEILAALPPGSEVRLDVEGRPVLPAAWTLPVVLPGQAPPVQDLASAYVTPASFRAGFDKAAQDAAQLGPLPSGANAASAWPVTKVQMADGAVIDPPANAALADGSSPQAALANQGRALDGVTLSVGAGTSLYNTFVPENARGGEGLAPECIEKTGGRTQFCIKELQWPAFLEPKFLVSTILYTGTGSVVRFDDGAPTRIHTVFNSDGFGEIADWLVRRFGPPTATVTRSVAPFGQARRDNPTMIWRAVDKVTQKTVSLEIRHFDDTRDGFPDIRNGVMMLYREGTPGIFPQVSVHELMRLKRTG